MIVVLENGEIPCDAEQSRQQIMCPSPNTPTALQETCERHKFKEVPQQFFFPPKSSSLRKKKNYHPTSDKCRSMTSWLSRNHWSGKTGTCEMLDLEPTEEPCDLHPETQDGSILQ